MMKLSESNRLAALTFLLIALIITVYWRTTGYGFISLDDGEYVAQNQTVKSGFTLESVKAAFTDKRAIPLTFLSYMADASAFGIDPGVFHRTNVLLFCVNAGLLFLFLRSATGSTWKSFFAVALWALHPMRVESVAWIAERKDLLAGLFFILALWSHLNFTRTRSPGWYIGIQLFALLGLLSKPIMVVLPVALLLLDFWPLGLFPQENSAKENWGNLKKLVLEKTPLIFLSIAFSALIFYIKQANRYAPDESKYDEFSLAVTSYARYLGRTFFPSDLVLDNDSSPVIAGAALTVAFAASLAVLSIAAYKLRKRAPEVTFGWFWFLLLLIPNSGIVASGAQNFADRFTYLPHIGLAVALTWGTARLVSAVGLGKRSALIPGAAAIVALTIASSTFTGYWKDSYTLFGHIDEISGGSNPLALNSLAIAFCFAENPSQGLVYFRRLKKLKPDYIFLNYHMGLALYQLGRYDESLAALREEMAFNPGDQKVSYLYALVLGAKTGK